LLEVTLSRSPFNDPYFWQFRPLWAKNAMLLKTNVAVLCINLCIFTPYFCLFYFIFYKNSDKIKNFDRSFVHKLKTPHLCLFYFYKNSDKIKFSFCKNSDKIKNFDRRLTNGGYGIVSRNQTKLFQVSILRNSFFSAENVFFSD
jgi:hypothetical protein